MKEVNDKVFFLIFTLKNLGFIKYEKDFCEAIKLKKQNLNNIKNGLTHFTINHIYLMSKVYNANPNYLFGLEENMFMSKVNKIVNNS